MSKFLTHSCNIFYTTWNKFWNTVHHIRSYNVFKCTSRSKSVSRNVLHYSDIIMSAMASQITGVSIVYATVCSGADQRKHQSSSPLAFVWAIHRWPVNFQHEGPVTRKCFHLMTSSWKTVLIWTLLPGCWLWNVAWGRCELRNYVHNTFELHYGMVRYITISYIVQHR